MSSKKDNQNIVIYKAEDNSVELKVQLEKDTVWLTQAQMASLFNKNKRTISEHINNIFKEGELKKDSVVRKFRSAGADGKSYNTNHYNLDVIISVGYRVKSLEGTQFRIWATNVLRKYIVQGYAINQKRLQSDAHKYKELLSQIQTLRNVIDNETFTLEQSKELVRVISDYAEGLELIDKVDHEEVELPASLTASEGKRLEYKEVRKDIEKLKVQLGAHELFGNEKDQGLQSALDAIFQTFDEKDLYPSLEEKAANLLYLVIKNHPFTDGNKRIGAFIFVRFLDLNGILYDEEGKRKIAENTLVAIALLIAQSQREQKDLMVKLVVNLLCL